MTAFPDTGFLSEASDRLKAMLSAQATEISLERGEVLFEQGDEGDALFAILEGTLEVSFLAMSGRKLSLTLMRPGEIFGEIALFDNGPRTATIAAAERSRVLRVRQGDVMEQIRHIRPCGGPDPSGRPAYAVDGIAIERAGLPADADPPGPQAVALVRTAR